MKQVTQLTEVDEMVGKTIKKIDWRHSFSRVILFTDNSIVALRVDEGNDDKAPEIVIDEDAVDFWVLERFGLMTAEEREEAFRQERHRYKQAREAAERAELARLKEKYK